MTFGALDNPTSRRDHEFGPHPLIRDPVRRVPYLPSTTLAGTVGVAPAAAAFSCRSGSFFPNARRIVSSFYLMGSCGVVKDSYTIGAAFDFLARKLSDSEDPRSAPPFIETRIAG
jgi:hypothetical protein